MKGTSGGGQVQLHKRIGHLKRERCAETCVCWHVNEEMGNLEEEHVLCTVRAVDGQLTWSLFACDHRQLLRKGSNRDH